MFRYRTDEIVAECIKINFVYYSAKHVRIYRDIYCIIYIICTYSSRYKYFCIVYVNIIV